MTADRRAADDLQRPFKCGAAELSGMRLCSARPRTLVSLWTHEPRGAALILGCGDRAVAMLAKRLELRRRSPAVDGSSAQRCKFKPYGKICLWLDLRRGSGNVVARQDVTPLCHLGGMGGLLRMRSSKTVVSMFWKRRPLALRAPVMDLIMPSGSRDSRTAICARHLPKCSAMRRRGDVNPPVPGGDDGSPRGSETGDRLGRAAATLSEQAPAWIAPADPFDRCIP